MKAIIAVLCLMLAGCSFLSDLLPCDEVDYQKSGTDIEVRAKCKAE